MLLLNSCHGRKYHLNRSARGRPVGLMANFWHYRTQHSVTIWRGVSNESARDVFGGVGRVLTWFGVQVTQCLATDNNNLRLLC